MNHKWRETSSRRAMCHQGHMQIYVVEISLFWDPSPFTNTFTHATIDSISGTSPCLMHTFNSDLVHFMLCTMHLYLV
jgi:hypothetical protein